jgi:hypothetical protein
MRRSLGLELRHRPRVAVTTILMVGLAAAGRGGGSTSSSGGGSNTIATTVPRADVILTKAKFLSRANAICTTSNKLIEMAAKKTLPSNERAKPTQAQLVRYAKLVTAAILVQIDGIRALGAPLGDKNRVTNMLSLVGQDLERVQIEPALLGNPDVFADFARLAHPYGLTSCMPEGDTRVGRRERRGL